MVRRTIQQQQVAVLLPPVPRVVLSEEAWLSHRESTVARSLCFFTAPSLACFPLQTFPPARSPQVAIGVLLAGTCKYGADILFAFTSATGDKKQTF